MSLLQNITSRSREFGLNPCGSNGMLMEVKRVYLITAIFLCVLTLNLRDPKGRLA
jgi:hypothetical protein